MVMPLSFSRIHPIMPNVVDARIMWMRSTECTCHHQHRHAFIQTLRLRCLRLCLPVEFVHRESLPPTPERQRIWGGEGIVTSSSSSCEELCFVSFWGKGGVGSVIRPGRVGMGGGQNHRLSFNAPSTIFVMPLFFVLHDIFQ